MPDDAGGASHPPARFRSVLLICAANTARSVMAEQLLIRELRARGAGDRVAVRSAGIAAYARDPALFEWRTRTQIEEGRSWLWEEGGAVFFKAEASAWTEHTVQLQQVWVDPTVRGSGYGKRGLADLCRLLLTRTPSVCLFVRPENAPAIALYDSIGMHRVGSYRSLIFE